ncbi:MAG: hypothetical protein ABII18_00070 [bacterium]|nr:hypothetical protein [bacterium]MBU1917582.1 hypothetical protein [bacterium]
MTTNNIDKSIADNFPFYSDDEQHLLKELVVQSDPKSDNFQAAKNNFLELLYSDLVHFYKWEATPDERINIRKRLLNVAGLFFIVPIHELRELAHRAKLTHKKLVYETAPDPLKAETVEMHSYDLKYIEGFQDFYSRIMVEPSLTALDYIAGNREKRQYPQSQLTVFRKNIQDEVISKEYLTASAEPLTQTQFISLYNPNGSTRDLITIGFDMVYESAFIDFFHNAPNVTPITLPRNAHIMGKHFLLAAVNETIRLKRTNKEFLEEFPVFLFDEDGGTPNRVDDLLFFITDSLVPQITQKIRHWNIKLGLDPENEFIHWTEETTS